ncbi:MAG: hypothetical protein M9894_38775 [Planctomycetes bacterium]|nr:hypothetical protein [Planctomycetota bacterium]
MTAAREAPRTTWTALALLALLVAPPLVTLLRVDAVGLLDYPGHALVARLHATDPLPPGAERAAVPRLAPYRALYDVLAVAGPARVDAVGRALLALYLLGAPLAALAVARAAGGDPRLALLAAPASTSLFWWSGFLAWLLAMPLLLLLVAACVTLAGRRREGPLGAAAGGACACLGLLYLLHPLALGLGVAVAVLGALCALAPGDAALERRRAGLLLLPAGVGLALVVAAAVFVVGGGASLEGRATPGDVVTARAHLLLTSGWRHLGPAHEPLARGAAALLAAGLALPLAARLRTPADGGSAPRARAVILGALAGCVLAALAVPFQVGPLHYVGPRFGLPALLLLGPALGALRLAGGRARALGVGLIVAGGLLHAVGAARALAALDRELAPAVAAGRALAVDADARGQPARVLVLAYPRTSATIPRFFDVGLSASAHAAHAAGVAADVFGNPFLPVRTAAAPGPEAPDGYDPTRHGLDATHALVRLPPDPGAAAGLLERLAGRFVLVAQAGEWRVLARRPT